MRNYIKLYITIFLLSLIFYPGILYAVSTNTPVGSTDGLLQSILDETILVRQDLDQLVLDNQINTQNLLNSLNQQNLAWSQSMSFLSGLLAGSAFVTAATRRW